MTTFCAYPEPTPSKRSNDPPRPSRPHKAALGERILIGDSLRFHTDEAQAVEVAIAVEVLNRMLDLGRPNSVRVA